jgi:hypothetical protein
MSLDEAFMPFQQMMRNLLALGNELVDEEQGVRSYIVKFEIESPVELQIVREEDGQVRIGTTPPLYRVQTSVLPSFHGLKFKAELARDSDGY